MFKQKNGITLIALVITIVVLLVLAGVVVNLSLGENGIIGKAQNAVDKYKKTQEEENIMLGKFENQIESATRNTKFVKHQFENTGSAHNVGGYNYLYEYTITSDNEIECVMPTYISIATLQGWLGPRRNKF